ncbi:MAG: hypothetical protein ACR2KJ_10295 [Jatrophihabitans sp.]
MSAPGGPPPNDPWSWQGGEQVPSTPAEQPAESSPGEPAQPQQQQPEQSAPAPSHEPAAEQPAEPPAAAPPSSWGGDGWAQQQPAANQPGATEATPQWPGQQPSQYPETFPQAGTPGQEFGRPDPAQQAYGGAAQAQQQYGQGNYGQPGYGQQTGGYGAQPDSAPAYHDPSATAQYGFGLESAAQQYPGAAAGVGWQQPPAAKKRSKTPLILGIVVVLVLGGLAGGYFAFFNKSKPKLTFNGKQIDNADQILTEGQKQVNDQVSSRHGVKSNDTRCYFAVPKTPASGTKKTDISNTLQCGPALFVDGSASQAYLSYNINQTSSKSGKVVLGLSATPVSPNPAAPPGSVELKRPDGVSAPSNSGNLKAPSPPAADKNALVNADLGPAQSQVQAAPTTAVMIGDTFGIRLNTVGKVDRYGRGDTARTAPSGTDLIAFTFEVTDGATGKSADTVAVGIQIGSGEPRSLPGRTPAVIVAVPSGQTATLVMVDTGVTQSLALPSGARGSKNVLINVRQHLTATVNKTGNFTVKLKAGSQSGSYTGKYTFQKVGLYGTLSSRHPAAQNAYLFGFLTWQRTSATKGPFTSSGGNGPFSFRTAEMSLQAGGKTYKPKLVGNTTVFEVPASITTGTIVVGGSYKQSTGTTETITPTLRLPFAIPAG